MPGFRVECVHCGEVIFTLETFTDVEIGLLLEHLWTVHPSMLQRPQTMLLTELIAVMRLRMA